MTPRERSTHEVYEQLAAGHALSALEPEEEQEFLAHLPSCPDCERALADHSETLAHLAYGAGAAEPPASLFETIRAEIRSEASAGDRLVAPTSLTAARERRQRRTVPLAAVLTGVAASLVLIVSLVASNLGLQEKNGEEEQRLTAMNRAVQALLVPGARQITLQGEGTKGVAVVNGNTVSLVMMGLEANDKRSIYVLWGKSSFGGVSAVGAFDVPSKDLAVVNGLKLANARTLEALMVTHEKGRKAPAMSTQAPVIASAA